MQQVKKGWYLFLSLFLVLQMTLPLNVGFAETSIIPEEQEDIEQLEEEGIVEEVEEERSEEDELRLDDEEERQPSESELSNIEESSKGEWEEETEVDVPTPIWHMDGRIVKAYTTGEVEYELAFRHEPIEGEAFVALEEATFYLDLPEGATFRSATFGGTYDEENHRVYWVNPGGIPTDHANFHPATPRRTNVTLFYDVTTEEVAAEAYATYTPKGFMQQETNRQEIRHTFDHEAPTLVEGIVVQSSIEGKDAHEPIWSGESFTYGIDYSLSSLDTPFQDLELVVQLPDTLTFNKHVQLTGDFTTYRYDEEKRQFIFTFQKEIVGATGKVKINNLQFPNFVTPDGTKAAIETWVQGPNIEPVRAETLTLTARAEANWNIVKKKFKPGVDPYPGEYVEYEIELSNASTHALGLLNISDVVLIDKLPEEAMFIEAYELPKNFSERIPGTYDEKTHTVRFDVEAPDQRPGKDNTKEFRVIVKYPDWTEKVPNWHENKNDLTEEERAYLENIQQKKVTNEAQLSYVPLGEERQTKEAALTHGFTLDIASPWDYVYTDKYVKSYQQEVAPGQEVTFYMNASNFSNVTLPRGELIDMTPEGLELTELVTGIYRGTEKYDILYTTAKDPKADDWVIWRKDHPAMYYSTLDINELGLDREITGVKIVFEEMSPMFYTITSFSPTYKLKEDFDFPEDVDRVPIRNIATIHAEYHDGFTKDFYADIVAVKQRPLLSLQASTVDDVMKPGDKGFNYEFQVKNTHYSSSDLRNPIIEVWLDPSLTHADWNWSLTDSKGRTIPKPKYKKEVIGSQEKMTWYWDEETEYTLPIDETLILYFNTNVSSNALGGDAVTQFHVRSNEHVRIGDYDYARVGETEDGKEYIYTDHTIKVDSEYSLRAEKSVRPLSDTSTTMNRLDKIEVNRGEPIVYDIVLENKGNLPLKAIDVVDVFPYVGDRGVLLNHPRHSKWQPQFQQLLSVPNGWSLAYSSSPNVGITTGDWKEQLPADKEVRALKLSSGDTVLQPGESITFSWVMNVPENAEGTAWNSFAVQATNAETNQKFLPTEPLKVGAFVKQEELSQLTLKKVDAETNEPLSGVKFRLTDGVTTFETEPTDETGTVIVDSIAPRTYEVTEVQPPEGYEPLQQPVRVTVSAGSEEIVTIENAPIVKEETTSIVVTKVDKDTNEPLQGATFALYENGEKTKEYTTDDKGMFVLPQLYVDRSYTLKELVAPEGYLLDATEYELDLSKESYTITNEKEVLTGLISLVKKDALTHHVLEGAVFELRNEVGDVLNRQVTDEEGTLIMSDVPLHEPLTLVEVQSPAHYQTDRNEYPILFTEENRHFEIEVVNVPVGSITLEKYDATTNEPLQGATFVVRQEGSEKGQTVTTNEIGVGTISSLPVGSYEVIEVEAPDGYVIDETPFTLIVSHGKETVYQVMNKKEVPVVQVGALVIEKYDQQSNALLEGAIFELIDAETNEVVVERIKTDVTGRLTIKNLPYGAYLLKEVEAPDGYRLSETPITVVIDREEVIERVSNEKQDTHGALVLTKVDETTEEPLQHAVFELRNEQDEVVSQRLVTNHEGRIQVSSLPPGVYYFVEVEAPKGYELDATPKRVVVAAGVTTSIQQTNKKEVVPKPPVEQPSLATIELQKVDRETGKPLQHAIFRFYDEDGQVMKDRLETDEDGMIRVERVPLGTYTFVEIEAPEGYVLDETPQVIHVASDQTVRQTMSNEKESVPQVERGSIEIKKIDAEDKKPLRGAIFRLEDERGEVLYESLMTDEKGMIRLDGLPFGMYNVVEVKAPAGYVLDATRHVVKVDEEVVSLEVSNERTPIVERFGEAHLLKVDAATEDVLKGAVFQLLDAEGKVWKDDLVTGSDGRIIVQGLKEGTYTFIEKQAPAGYVLDQSPHVVEVKEEAIVEVIHRNEKEDVSGGGGSGTDPEGTPDPQKPSTPPTEGGETPDPPGETPGNTKPKPDRPSGGGGGGSSTDPALPEGGEETPEGPGEGTPTVPGTPEPEVPGEGTPVIPGTPEEVPEETPSSSEQGDRPSLPPVGDGNEQVPPPSSNDKEDSSIVDREDGIVIVPPSKSEQLPQTNEQWNRWLFLIALLFVGIGYSLLFMNRSTNK